MFREFLVSVNVDDQDLAAVNNREKHADVANARNFYSLLTYFSIYQQTIKRAKHGRKMF